MAFASPSHTVTDKHKEEALTTSAIISIAMHAAVATAVIVSVSATPPALPSAPIMVRMITSPMPEPLRPPEPEILPLPKPATKKPQPAPKTLLVAEKPAAEPDKPAEAAPAPPPPPAAAVAGEPKPAPIELPPRFDAAYLNNPSPPYPLLAKRMGEQGRVMLRVHVSADGAAETVELRSSSGSARLDQSAIDTVKRWRFVPAKLGTQPIAAWVLVPINFMLGA